MPSRSEMFDDHHGSRDLAAKNPVDSGSPNREPGCGAVEENEKLRLQEAALENDGMELAAKLGEAEEALQEIYDRHHMTGDGSAGRVSGDALRRLGIDPDASEQERAFVEAELRYEAAVSLLDDDNQQLQGAIKTLERIRDHANSAEEAALLAQLELDRISAA
jgi:hypothetical protein